MDLEMKTESPEFVVNVFQTYSDNEVIDQNEEFGSDPLAVNMELSELARNVFQHSGENGAENGYEENGDFSSDLTLISVST